MTNKIPLKIRFLSSFSLLIAVVLIFLLLFFVYTIWDILFYILLGALIIGFLYRLIHQERGIVLMESDAPKLFNMVNSVSKSLGMNSPKKIILTPSSSIGVAGIWERKLLIGMGVLHMLTEKEIYSILFHEFAHFKGADNVIGSSMMLTTMSLRDIVTATSYLHFIVFLPFLIFYYIFASLTLLYSRQREYLADYIASSFVGGMIFGESLENYVKVSVEFDSKIDFIIRHYASQNLALKNIYDAYRKVGFTGFNEQFEANVTKNVKNALEKSSILSTHPSTSSRIKRVKEIKGSLSHLPKGRTSDLFTNFEKQEIEMTDLVYSKIVKKK